MTNTWKKIILSLIASGMLAAPSLKGTESFCNPLFPSYAESCFTDDFNVEIDFIFWKPCLNAIDYAAVVRPTSNGTKVHFEDICLDWTPGVHATIGRPSFFYDWGFLGSYIFCESKQHEHVHRNQGIAAPVFQIGLLPDLLFNKASASYELVYQEWDLLLTYEFCCNHGTLFTPFFGIAGIYVDQDLDVKVFSDEDHHKASWSSLYWGIGFRAGADYQLYLTRCLRLYSTFNGTLLAGEAKSKHKQSIVDRFKFKDDNCCRFVPGCFIGTGIYYDTAICDIDFTVRLGYEFRYWYNMPRNRFFSGQNARGEASNSTSSHTRILAYQGLTAGIAMTF